MHRLRALADADAFADDVKGAVLEEVACLASDGNDLGVRLVLDEGHRHLEGIARVCACEALIRRHHKNEAFALCMLLEQRMRDIRGSRRHAPNDLSSLFGIGTVVVRGLLGTAQTRGRDHVHGVRDLLDALDAADAAPNIL